jgi:hypothetical protein
MPLGECHRVGRRRERSGIIAACPAAWKSTVDRLPEATSPAAAAASACLVAALAGCGTFKNNEEAQAVVSKRIVGMPAGDFFEQFGRARSRSAQPDGSALYTWESAMGPAPPGPHGPDERICRLRMMADKRGRIESVTVQLDDPGRVSSSRCGELFRPK